MPPAFSIKPTNFPHGVTSQGSPVLTQLEAGVGSPVVGQAFIFNEHPGVDGTIFAIGDIAGAHEVILMVTGSGAATITTPTAAEIIAAVPGWTIGGMYRFRLCNPTSGGITIAPGAGVTITGLTLTAANKWREWLVRYTAAGAVNFRDVGSGNE